MQRIWTRAEIDQLIHLRSRNFTHQEIADTLGRTARSVSQQWQRLGLSKTPRVPRDCDGRWEFKRRVLRLHRNGLSAREIALKIGCAYGSVRKCLARSGLTPNGFNHRFSAKRRRIVREMTKSTGWTLGDIAAESQRRKAAQLGWPECNGPAQARILQCLYSRGPMLRRDLCKALGYKNYGAISNALNALKRYYLVTHDRATQQYDIATHLRESRELQQAAGVVA